MSALRRAFMSAYNSPELRAESGKKPVDPMNGEQVAALIEKVIDQPPEVVTLLKGLTWSE